MSIWLFDLLFDMLRVCVCVLREQGWTELLARQLLGLPRRPALVWFGAAWRDFGAGAHGCSAATYRPILAHYGVPPVKKGGGQFLPFSWHQITCAFS